MATFYANPDEQKEIWIERAALENYGFRIWHLMFFCFSGFVILLVLICCCVKIRIPRTKQQIEADYRRKKLAEKFRERLKLIQNQDMDALDLHRALQIIQEDYRSEDKNIQYELESNCLPPDYNVVKGRENYQYMHAEPQQPANFAKKIANMMKISKMPSTHSSSK